MGRAQLADSGRTRMTRLRRVPAPARGQVAGHERDTGPCGCSHVSQLAFWRSRRAISSGRSAPQGHPRAAPSRPRRPGRPRPELRRPPRLFRGSASLHGDAPRPRHDGSRTGRLDAAHSGARFDLLEGRPTSSRRGCGDPDLVAAGPGLPLARLPGGHRCRAPASRSTTLGVGGPRAPLADAARGRRGGHRRRTSWHDASPSPSSIDSGSSPSTRSRVSPSPRPESRDGPSACGCSQPPNGCETRRGTAGALASSSAPSTARGMPRRTHSRATPSPSWPRDAAWTGERPPPTPGGPEANGIDPVTAGSASPPPSDKSSPSLPTA